MCGRYNIITNAKALHDAFKILGEELDFSGIEDRYNISPSTANASPDRYTTCPVIRYCNGKLEVAHLVWPLIPLWAKGRISKYNTANARLETLRSANSYKNAWNTGQRCLVPATGFYEWQQTQEGRPKQPYHIQINDRPIFAMTGIWESSASGNGDQTVESFAIVTTEANALMARIHNTNRRMPVILAPADYLTWLTGSAEDALDCLKTVADSEMNAYQISTFVNNPRNNDARCVAALSPDAAAGD